MFLQMLIRKGNTGFYKINKTIKGINAEAYAGYYR